MVSDRQVSDVLEDAAALLERDGWCQGLYHRGTSSCLVGALMVASHDSDEPDMREKACAMVRRVIKDRSSNVIGWNDWPGRTQAEVVATLREAAALAKAEGR